MGTEFVKAPEDRLPVILEHEPPYEGDLDIQLHIGLDQPVELQDLALVASPICTSVLVHLNAALGELLIPAAPLQVRMLEEAGRSSFADSMTMCVRERPLVTLEAVEELLVPFIEKRRDMTKEEAAASSAAARRFMTATIETDPMDKYCDLWESCEFAVRFERAKGGIVGCIAKATATHWNGTSGQRRLEKAQVERQLGIKRLYQTRGQIVHEALDNAEGLYDRMAMLESIATELLRYRFGMPFSTNGKAFEALSAIGA
ncbi:MAG: hypothetical protein ACYC6T_18355 [Thermoleophilia bacterium]